MAVRRTFTHVMGAGLAISVGTRRRAKKNRNHKPKKRKRQPSNITAVCQFCGKPYVYADDPTACTLCPNQTCLLKCLIEKGVFKADMVAEIDGSSFALPHRDTDTAVPAETVRSGGPPDSLQSTSLVAQNNGNVAVTTLTDKPEVVITDTTSPATTAPISMVTPQVATTVAEKRVVQRVDAAPGTSTLAPPHRDTNTAVPAQTVHSGGPPDSVQSTSLVFQNNGNVAVATATDKPEVVATDTTSPATTAPISAVTPCKPPHAWGAIPTPENFSGVKRTRANMNRDPNST